MRIFAAVSLILFLVSCNLNATKNIPGVGNAMPKPWQQVKFEEELLPYKGYSFDPVFISEKSELIGFLKWKGVDSGYHELFNLDNENLVVYFRPEQTGNMRYSLWSSAKLKKIAVRKEDLSHYSTYKTFSPSYIVFYRVPKSTPRMDVEQR